MRANRSQSSQARSSFLSVPRVVPFSEFEERTSARWSSWLGSALLSSGDAVHVAASCAEAWCRALERWGVEGA
eukprot:516672-Pleurochrysis_carterae.AAC.1